MEKQKLSRKERKKRLIAEARRRFGNDISPCAGYKTLEECCADVFPGEMGFWFNKPSKTTILFSEKKLEKH